MPLCQPDDLKAASTEVYTDEVKREQEDVLWSDAIVTIAPIWFGAMPGFLKGYFDKVFMTKFAYDVEYGGKIKGKRVFSFFTAGSNVRIWIWQVNMSALIFRWTISLAV